LKNKVAINQMITDLDKTILQWTELDIPIEAIEKLEWIKMNCENWLNSITYQSNVH
jgi:predicted HAD superfamily phosphohydrolase YqeG